MIPMTSLETLCRRSRRLSVALCAVAVLGVAGCSEESPPESSSLSKAELISQGDAICAETEEKLAPVFGALFPTGSETPPASEAAGPMRTAATELRAEYNEFSALEPPEADREKFDAILEKFDLAVKDVEKSAELAEAGDTEGYLTNLEAANSTDAESRELMKEYGFMTCAGETGE